MLATIFTLSLLYLCYFLKYFTVCIIVVLKGNKFSGIESYAVCNLLRCVLTIVVTLVISFLAFVQNFVSQFLNALCFLS